MLWGTHPTLEDAHLVKDLQGFLGLTLLVVLLREATVALRRVTVAALNLLAQLLIAVIAPGDPAQPAPRQRGPT